MVLCFLYDFLHILFLTISGVFLGFQGIGGSYDDLMDTFVSLRRARPDSEEDIL